MRKMTLDEKLEVIKAYSDGKEVYVLGSERKWFRVTNDTWYFEDSFYMVKPISETHQELDIGVSDLFKGDSNEIDPMYALRLTLPKEK